MPMRKQRPKAYDDVLVTMHVGETWFGFTAMIDGVERSLPHTYENLVIHPVNGVTHDKPTEDYLDTELAKMQAAWDAEDYARKRELEYPSIDRQLAMIYDDQVNGTTTFRDTIKAVKDKYPKS